MTQREGERMRVKQWWKLFVHWWRYSHEYAEFCKICNPSWEGFKKREQPND